MGIPPVRVGLLAAVVITGLALAGCTTVSPPNDVTPTPTSSASTASPTPTNDPANWEISFEGVGPLTLGGSISAEQGEVGSSYTRQPSSSCSNATMSMFSSPDGPTIWVQIDGLGSDVVSNILVGADASNSPRAIDSPKTREGIGIGSTVEQLRAAYPTAQLDEIPDMGLTHYFVDDPATESDAQGQRHVVFGVGDDAVRVISVQRNTQYLWDFCGMNP